MTMEARGHTVREYESTGLRIEQFLFSFYLNAIICTYCCLFSTTKLPCAAALTAVVGVHGKAILAGNGITI